MPYCAIISQHGAVPQEYTQAWDLLKLDL
ncbi:hypothetical protein EMIT0P171_80182 [Pseudomonas sp. IT-P171]